MLPIGYSNEGRNFIHRKTGRRWVNVPYFVLWLDAIKIGEAKAPPFRVEFKTFIKGRGIVKCSAEPR